MPSPARQTASRSRAEADIILRNGPIWCGREQGLVEALAVWRDRVLAVGPDTEIAALAGPATRIIDLDGRLATPGLNDAHLHLVSYGMVMDWVDARPAAAPTLAALLAAIRGRAAQQRPGEWILARGYDQTKLDVGRHPDRSELDRAAPDNPVMLVRTCGHISICNSRALERAGIDERTAAPAGGVIERQPDGRLSGLLAENARAPVRAAIPVPEEAEIVAAIERAGRHLLSLGITSCMDAAVGQIAGFAEIAAYHRAKREGRLPVRTLLTLLGEPGGILAKCHEAGLVTGTGDALLAIGAVKIFLDGSAGGRTAWMSRPYLGDDGTRGVQMLSDDDLNRLVLDAHLKGYRLACHAIGDAAIEQLITAYEKALAILPDPKRRHRVEHCGFSTAAQHARMVKAGIYPCPQQIFIHDFGDAYIAVLGAERALSSYPFGTWIALGLKPATGSDAPVCEPDPFPNIHAMLTRQTWRGTVMDERERVSIAAALQAYTEFGAFSQGMEQVKGKLEPGFLADVAVFSRNLLTASPDEILHDTRCDLTMLGGKVVHDRLSA